MGRLTLLLNGNVLALDTTRGTYVEVENRIVRKDWSYNLVNETGKHLCFLDLTWDLEKDMQIKVRNSHPRTVAWYQKNDIKLAKFSGWYGRMIRFITSAHK